MRLNVRVATVGGAVVLAVGAIVAIAVNAPAPTEASPSTPLSAAEPRADRLDRVGGDPAGLAEQIVGLPAAPGSGLVPDEFGNHLAGFAGLRIDQAANTLDLYWVGEPPSEVSALIAASTVTTTVHSAAYDMPTMQEATTRLVQLIEDDRVPQGISPIAFGPANDGSGLTVMYLEMDSLDDESVALILSTILDFPVVAEAGGPIVAQ